MAPVVAVSGQPEILMRWAGLLESSGRACMLEQPDRLTRGKLSAGSLCLFDLGPRGGMDPQPLIEAVRAHPQSAVIAASARPEAREGLGLLRSGVRGYYNRLASAQVLSALLATVEAGEIWAGREVNDYLLHRRFAEDTGSPTVGAEMLAQLTAREAEMARQVAAGLSNKVIAADNGISERTVKAHLNSIFRKTGVRSRVQLALAISGITGKPIRSSSG